MPNKTINARSAVLALSAIAALTAACSSSATASGGGTSAPPSTGSTAPTLTLESSSASTPPPSTVAITVSGGKLVAPDGHTLYYNTVDTSKVIKCVEACASAWPPLVGTAKPSGKGLTDKDFGTTGRPDGTTQVTYFGHPLYEFSGDMSAGPANGQGMADAGGTWITAKLNPPGNPGGGKSSHDDTSAPPSLPAPSAPAGGATSGGY